MSFSASSLEIWSHTLVEATANGGYYNLHSKKDAHGVEDRSLLVVDGVNTDNVDDRASGEEDCSANGLEEEEVGALLTINNVRCELELAMC